MPTDIVFILLIGDPAADDAMDMMLDATIESEEDRLRVLMPPIRGKAFLSGETITVLDIDRWWEDNVPESSRCIVIARHEESLNEWVKGLAVEFMIGVNDSESEALYASEKHVSTKLLGTDKELIEWVMQTFAVNPEPLFQKDWPKFSSWHLPLPPTSNPLPAPAPPIIPTNEVNEEMALPPPAPWLAPNPTQPPLYTPSDLPPPPPMPQKEKEVRDEAENTPGSGDEEPPKKPRGWTPSDRRVVNPPEVPEKEENEWESDDDDDDSEDPYKTPEIESILESIKATAPTPPKSRGPVRRPPIRANPDDDLISSARPFDPTQGPRRPKSSSFVPPGIRGKQRDDDDDDDEPTIVPRREAVEAIAAIRPFELLAGASQMTPFPQPSNPLPPNPLQEAPMQRSHLPTNIVKPKPTKPRSSFQDKIGLNIGALLGSKKRMAPSPEIAQIILHKKPVIIAVGSLKGGVGKTSISAALGVLAGEALEHLGSTAAIVDANINNPSSWGELHIPSHTATVRDYMTKLERGDSSAVLPGPVYAHTPALAIYPEDPVAGEGYDGASIHRFCDYLRKRHAIVIIDLANHLPTLDDPIGAVVSQWLIEADVVVVPTDYNPSSIQDCMTYLNCPSMRNKAAVVPYRANQFKGSDRTPALLEALNKIEAKGIPLIRIPEDNNAIRVLWQGESIADASQGLRDAYLKLIEEVVKQIPLR